MTGRQGEVGAPASFVISRPRGQGPALLEAAKPAGARLFALFPSMRMAKCLLAGVTSVFILKICSLVSWGFLSQPTTSPFTLAALSGAHRD